MASGKEAIAHEVIGHYKTVLKGTSFNTALDEAQAGIRTARFAPGLNFEERAILIRDGLQRLGQEGLKINDVRHLLDIAER